MHAPPGSPRIGPPGPVQESTRHAVLLVTAGPERLHIVTLGDPEELASRRRIGVRRRAGLDPCQLKQQEILSVRTPPYAGRFAWEQPPNTESPTCSPAPACVAFA